MPDEDTTTAGPAADTDAQKPAGSEADADSAELDLLDLRPGTGAQAEQESQDDKPETEQEQGQEEAGGDKAISDLVAELEKEDPEFAKALAKGRGEEAEPEDPLSDREAKIVQDEARIQSNTARGSEYASIVANYNASHGAAIATLATGLDAEQANLERLVEQAGGEKVGVDLNRMAALIKTYGQEASRIAEESATRKTLSSLKERVLLSAASAHFTDEDRKTITEFNPSAAIPDMNGVIDTMLNVLFAASARSAPKRIREAATKDAEAKVGLTETQIRLREMLGARNGRAKSSAGEGGGGASSPNSLTEIDEALRNGPTAEIDGLLKRRAALIE